MRKQHTGYDEILQEKNSSEGIERHLKPFTKAKKKAEKMETVYEALLVRKQEEIELLESELAIESQRKVFGIFLIALQMADPKYREEYLSAIADENIDLNALEYYLACEDILEKQIDLENRYRSRKKRIDVCGQELIFAKNPETEKKRLTEARFFCRVKLCPMCEWRRTIKLYSDLSVVLNELEKRGKFELLFLTLTIKNVVAGELETTLQQMQHGLYKMQKKKFYKDAICGSFSSLEITHNWHRDTYHPHFHLLLVAEKDYFAKNYITFETWRLEWQVACGLNYKPQVHIEAVKPKSEIVKEMTKSILHVQNMSASEHATVVQKMSHYMLKEKDYTAPEYIKNQKKCTEDAVEALDKTLHHKRFCIYRGILKKIFGELKVLKIFNKNIFPLREDLIYIIYYWHRKNHAYLEQMNHIINNTDQIDYTISSST